MQIDVSKVNMYTLLSEFYDRANIMPGSEAKKLYRPGTLSQDECMLEYKKARQATTNSELQLVVSTIRGRFVPIIIDSAMRLDTEIWDKFYGPGSAEKIVQFAMDITEKVQQTKEK